MVKHSLGSMILLSTMNYATWKPRMENILFCKNLHDSLENKGDKPIATKDDEWRKINKKTIGLINIVHWTQELGDIGSFSQQFSANGKLTSSMVMDVLFNEEAQEEGWWRSQAKGHTVRCFYYDQDGHIKRDFPKYKAHDQFLETAATLVMAVDEDESDVLLAISADGKSIEYWIQAMLTTCGELLSDMGLVILARRMDKRRNYCTEVRKASLGILGGSVTVPRGFGVVQEHKEMLWDMYGSLLYSEGPETRNKSLNLKTSYYPLVGWRERLLSATHLDESKLTWMSPNLVAKPKAKPG
ncbi:hypothetical protein Acr_09g0003520 [Actinidia rufa]|uniref:Uncharacterized protein n=1 Tax=Actinidia rufa TaxID=165716 RepID=A0A7J0F656_9ERIC|nr:hypothetical protein Acr_09g0003520 [Actinidia rufa]